MRLATLALLAVFAWWVMPQWLQDGMFMDGQIYAAVAQNLADGSVYGLGGGRDVSLPMGLVGWIADGCCGVV
jgi:hypothetical protein